jgi:hypothetical protein
MSNCRNESFNAIQIIPTQYTSIMAPHELKRTNTQVTFIYIYIYIYIILKCNQ